MKTFPLFCTALLNCLDLQLPAALAGDPLDQWHQLNPDADLDSVPNRAIGYAPGKWMGVDNDYRLLSSTNGRQWTVVKTFTAEEFPIDLDFTDNLWVLGGNLSILTSPNGQTWTAASIPAGESGYMRSLRHTSQGWIALVHLSQGGTRLLRSLDGRNWTWEVLGSLPNNDFLLDLTYGNGQWLGIANRSLVSSTDLSQWQVVGSRVPGRIGLAIPCPTQFQRLEFIHGLWVAIAREECAGVSGSSIWTSIEGVKWTGHYLRYEGQYQIQDIRDITFANGRLVAVDRIGSMLKSDPLVSLELKRPGEVTVRRASGIPVVIESSDDLRQWQMNINLTLGSPLESITNLSSGSIPSRFYRARTP